MNLLLTIPGFIRHKVVQILTGKTAKPLGENSPAPDFELSDESGRIHRLQDYRGKSVVLWFFIRAQTPG
jgi:hypothetical protein